MEARISIDFYNLNLMETLHGVNQPKKNITDSLRKDISMNITLRTIMNKFSRYGDIILKRVYSFEASGLKKTFS